MVQKGFLGHVFKWYRKDVSIRASAPLADALHSRPPAAAYKGGGGGGGGVQRSAYGYIRAVFEEAHRVGFLNRVSG